jgi:hypothetical protein
MTRENAVTRYGLFNADLATGYFVTNEIDSLLCVKSGYPRQALPVVRSKVEGRRGSRAAKVLLAEEDGWWSARESGGGRVGRKELEAVAGDEAQ